MPSLAMGCLVIVINPPTHSKFIVCRLLKHVFLSSPLYPDSLMYFIISLHIVKLIILNVAFIGPRKYCVEYQII